MIYTIFLFSILIILSKQQQIYLNQGNDWPGTCQEGSAQSPIDIKDVKGTCDNSMMVNMVLKAEDILTSVNKSLQGLKSVGQFTILHAKDIDGNLVGYDGYEIQVKSPSEHQIEGTQYDIEVQFYHNIKAEFKIANDAQQKTKAVVCIFFNQDSTKSSKFFDVWKPQKVENSFNLNLNATLGEVFSTSDDYYSYQGSITQPPCDEVVNWYIFNTVFSMSTIQYSDISLYLQRNIEFAKGNGSNRAIQSLNDRVIKKGNIACEEQFIYFFSFFILYIFINYFIFKLL
ncbi:hypothetical protein IMG5_156530 [Ichthyophthirius multifiliis]|uniref:Alpha-carbonic anhydrase domain-containing protein n=1 Tax=Ichthyophthirius multifiliis TaxID=5932 RepID=G0QZG4_ICHMU|nr:hypothetical protein IMG5_156530 [Ichthyophthirius multifiliis]EGR29388.1 hypothetical protein IMG5_156530 [Ichthyophthirius multifiliis]|eukprot:XP_004030624.1 hypothetical protein IMG5_156530 [Ichthyophthirius multifiliis]